jgi:hypothetical protein
MNGLAAVGRRRSEHAAEPKLAGALAVPTRRAMLALASQVSPRSHLQLA